MPVWSSQPNGPYSKPLERRRARLVTPIAEEEKKKVQAETELKLQLIENERKRLEEEKEAQKGDAEQQRLIERATSKATLSRFQPFLAPGYAVLARDDCRWGANQEHKGPVSYKDMQHCSTLGNVKRFVSQANHQKNDRPKWNTPSNDQEWGEMEKRLADFKLYLPIWLEKGLLAP